MMRKRTDTLNEGGCYSPRVPWAFTLIELLVLLLMTCLFAMLLLPALARTNPNPKWTICRNNLRTLGTAFALYANENRDYLPFPNWDGGSTFNGKIVPGWLYTATNGSIPDPGPGGAYANNPAAAYATGLWFPYIRQPRAYLCPVGAESSTYAARGLRNNRLSTYIANGAPCGFGLTSNFRTSCRTTEVWSPRCYMLWEPDENEVGPGIPGPFVFNDGAAFPSGAEGIGRLHSRAGADILCTGGQVEFVSFPRFKQESEAAGKSLAWWNPFSSSGH
ncbi:MAG TPA: hypothetical protein VHI52_01545 [Verrucomicrobiae bacterium]|nr:hypothetical protein [Verrucomicrobiae bacterium]